MSGKYQKAKTSEEDTDEEDDKSKRTFIIVIVVMVLLLVLATVDSFTTRYFNRMCSALAVWTMANAPWSFIAFEFIILVFLVLCLPYGPLGVLSGALFYQKYGKSGIVLAGVLLCTFTTAGAIIAFLLARHKFKSTVQKMINRQPKLKFLKNLDRLIQNGQGIEMVVLIRLAPLPKGPTNYFLGTTSVTFREFFIGSMLVNLPMSFVDVSIGAGASSVKTDSPLSMALFALAVVGFICLLCYVGSRAKRKLHELDDQDHAAEANEELGVLTSDDEGTYTDDEMSDGDDDVSGGSRKIKKKKHSTSSEVEAIPEEPTSKRKERRGSHRSSSSSRKEKGMETTQGGCPSTTVSDDEEEGGRASSSLLVSASESPAAAAAADSLSGVVDSGDQGEKVVVGDGENRMVVVEKEENSVGDRESRKGTPLDQLIAAPPPQPLDDDDAAAAAAAAPLEASSSSRKDLKKQKHQAAAAAASEPAPAPPPPSVPVPATTMKPSNLLDKVDSLQVVGKPNSWAFPDPRLNLTRLSSRRKTPEQQQQQQQRTEKEDAEVLEEEEEAVTDELVVQLTSQSFSFQILSARVGWALRVYPRDAAPRMSGLVHANQKGVLVAGDRDGVKAASADVSGSSREGHGHNFHVVESVGDTVKIIVRRTLKKEAGAGSESAATTTLTAAQHEKIDYQVWYEVVSRGVCKDPLKAQQLAEDKERAADILAEHHQQQHQQEGATSSPASPDNNEGKKKSKKVPKRSTSRRLKITIQDFELNGEASFQGGDGVELSSSKLKKLKQTSSPAP